MAAAARVSAKGCRAASRLLAAAASVPTVSVLETVRRLARGLAAAAGALARRGTAVGKPLAARAKAAPQLNRRWPVRLAATSLAGASTLAELSKRMLADAARRVMAPLHRQKHRPR
jgi:hypothetical protein